MGNFPGERVALNRRKVSAVAGTLYVCEFEVTESFKPEGVEVLNGEAVGGKVVVAIYDRYGNLVATSNTAGTAQSGANAFQKVALASGNGGLQPGQYFLALQANESKYQFRAIKDGSLRPASVSLTGTFGTLPKPLTTPTTFVANVAPIATIY